MSLFISKTKLLKMGAACLTASLFTTLSAQNTLISGDIGTAGNWDDGVLPTTANPANNPGIIDSSNTGVNEGTINGTYDDLVIEQTGGDVVRSGFGNSIFNNVNWEITGGTFTSTSLGHQMNSNSVLTIDGGTTSFASLTYRSSTVNLISGSLSTNADLQSQGGAFLNASGGTITVGRDAMLGFQPTTTINLSGTTIFSVTRNMGDIDVGVRTLNIGLGSGSVSVGGFLEVDGFTMDWTSGSGFTFSAASILDNGESTTWETLWNAGSLKVDGGNVGTFSDNFQLTGSTLTLIPEPSTLALMALAGLAVFATRRRR
jgi:hypothetical protein